MELQSLHLPTSNPTFCPLICNFFAGKPSIHAHFLRFANGNEYPLARKLELFRVRARQGSSGAIKFSSTAIEVSQENVASKDDNLVFVAGATGRVGSRAVRELLKLGFHVRAGVRSAQRAESLVQSVRQMKLDNETAAGMTQPEEKLEIVECDLEKRDQIEPALGSASVVLCCIGASEKEVFDITGPYRIDYLATKNLIDAATVAKVKHFILLTSLGTNKVGFPAAILNLFWGVLIWKRKAEEVLIASGLPYTIFRPGGMERPTDSYKLTHNITLAPEDTLFGGQVSNLQVAELMAFMAKNQSLSYCKVVEVIAETTAPLTPMEELLAKIPSKRDNLTQETTVRPASPPPKSMEVEAPTIPMKKEAPEEEAVEKDAESKLNPAPSKDPIPQVLNTVAEAEAVAPRGAKPSPLSPYPVYEDLKPPTSPSPAPPSGRQTPMVVVDAQPGTLDTQPGIMEATDGTATSKSATTPMQKTQRLSPYTAYEDLKPPSSASKSSPGIPKEEPLITPTMVDGTPNIVDGVVFGKASQDSSSCCSPFPMYEDLKPPTSPTPTAPSSSGIGKAFADGEPEFTTIGGNNATAETTEVKVETDVKSSAELKPRPLSPYTMYHDMKPPTTPMPCPKKH